MGYSRWISWKGKKIIKFNRNNPMRMLTRSKNSAIKYCDWKYGQFLMLCLYYLLDFKRCFWISWLYHLIVKKCDRNTSNIISEAEGPLGLLSNFIIAVSANTSCGLGYDYFFQLMIDHAIGLTVKLKTSGIKVFKAPL